MEKLKIIRVENFPFEGFETLKRESVSEGFHFLQRLEKDWISGKNRFDKTGEGYYAAYGEGELWAVLGINQDPYISKDGYGKIRRFYVKQDKRGQGIGCFLLKYLIRKHLSYFDYFSLYTDQEAAARFYESYGFKPYSGELKISHVLDFSESV